MPPTLADAIPTTASNRWCTWPVGASIGRSHSHPQQCGEREAVPVDAQRSIGGAACKLVFDVDRVALATRLAFRCRKDSTRGKAPANQRSRPDATYEQSGCLEWSGRWESNPR